MTIIAKNSSGGDLHLSDFGIELIASAQRELTEIFSLSYICASNELKTLVSATSITINDGTDDLSVADGLAAITVETKKEDEDNDPSGSGWIISATEPSSPTDGLGWYNTSNGILFVYDGTRLKWLAIDRVTITLSRLGKLKGGVYAYIGDVLSDEVSGVSLPFDSTLVGMSVRTRNPSSSFGCAYETDYTNEFDFYLDSNGLYVNDSLNVDLDQGEMGQIYFWDSGNNRDAICHLIYARRN